MFAYLHNIVQCSSLYIMWKWTDPRENSISVFLLDVTCTVEFYFDKSFLALDLCCGVGICFSFKKVYVTSMSFLRSICYRNVPFLYRSSWILPSWIFCSGCQVFVFFFLIYPPSLCPAQLKKKYIYNFFFFLTRLDSWPSLKQHHVILGLFARSP